MVDINRIPRQIKPILELSINKLHCWIMRNGWAGYDPYDIKDWHNQRIEPWYRYIREPIEKNRLTRKFQILMLKIEDKFPFPVRRILRINKNIYPKAMGLFLESYAKLYRWSKRDACLDIAKQCAQWLVNHVSEGYRGFGWGLPIDWQSRIFIPKETPCGIVSVICGEGFWELFHATQDERYLDYCQKVCEGFLRDLHIDKVGNGAICFSFTPLDHFHVHNPNLWIAAYLIKVGQFIENQEYIQVGSKASQYALNEQGEDGSLTYWGSDQDVSGALDHYHSGFELRSLHSLWLLTTENKYREALENFYLYYLENFIGENGEPWRNPQNPYIIDVHGCAEALFCNAQLSRQFSQANLILEKVTHWTIQNMQNASGYFIYRINKNFNKITRIDVPYIRWGQAWMMRGLVEALLACRETKGE